MEPPFASADVAAAFAAHGPVLQGALCRLRRLILEAAAAQSCIGPLVETLKWGEPAYRPQRPRTGTTVRLNALKDGSGDYAAFFHCQTTLLATFRDLYPGQFRFAGNRALIFAAGQPVPEDAFRHCAALALTYHLKT